MNNKQIIILMVANSVILVLVVGLMSWLLPRVGLPKASLGSVGSTLTYSGGTMSSSTISTTATNILAANSNRFYAMICNESPNAVWLGMDASATPSAGIRLNASSTGANSCYEILPEKLFLGRLTGVSTAATTVINTFEK